MPEFSSVLASLFTLTFAVTSMLSMGLRLTVHEIAQSLSDIRLVLLALAANFLIVPAAAFALSLLLLTNPDLQIGLVLVGMVAGSPLGAKLTQTAKGDVVFAVGLVALLVVITVIYVPLALPLLEPGAQIDALAIVTPLSLQILLPLIVGLVVKAGDDEVAEWLAPIMSQSASISLALMLVLLLGLSVGEVVGLIGTGTIIAIILLVAIALAAGYFLGGPDARTRRALALNTGQRNLAAAFVIGASTFGGRPNVLVVLVAAGFVITTIVVLAAGVFHRRNEALDSGAPKE